LCAKKKQEKEQNYINENRLGLISYACGAIESKMDLPEQVLVHIFGHLPLEAVGLTCGVVSRDWNEAVESPLLWKYLAFRDLDVENDPGDIEDWKQFYRDNSTAKVFSRFQTMLVVVSHLVIAVVVLFQWVPDYQCSSYEVLYEGEDRNRLLKKMLRPDIITTIIARPRLEEGRYYFRMVMEVRSLDHATVLECI
jgi:hypothetical protein